MAETLLKGASEGESVMALPMGPEYRLPILIEVERDRGQSRGQDLYKRIVDHFPGGSISQRDLDEELRSGEAKYRKDIQGEADRLKGRNGGSQFLQLAAVRHGDWVITPAGRSALRRLLVASHKLPEAEVDEFIPGTRKLWQVDPNWRPAEARRVIWRRRRS